MANEFKLELGAEAEIIGGFTGIVVARGTVETIVDTNPKHYYHIRKNEKTAVAYEAELVFFSE